MSADVSKCHVLIAGLQQVRRSRGLMGWWMGLTPEDSPMVLRDTSIQEVYATLR
jgi:hypothetical protein